MVKKKDRSGDSELKWAVLSDVHGNLEALEAVLGYISKEDINKVAFLGDIVGYGANPNECIDLLRGKAEVIVAGNHDCGTIGLVDISCFNIVAKAAIRWTRKQISSDNSSFLSGISLTSVVDDLTFVHSTPCDPQNWGYLFSKSDVIKNFNFYQNRICFLGHSHVPAIFIKDSKGRVISSRTPTIQLKDGYKYMINVGSVGQPRDGIPMAAFGVFDAGKSLFTLNRVPYDIKTAQEKIRVAGLPEALAKRLAVGR